MTKELKSTQLKKKTFLANMSSTLGNITSSCIAAGISRQTYYNWIKEDWEFMQSVEDVFEESIDFAESSLMEQIKNGDTTATIFYLKTKGKSRGYVEKTQNETIVKNDMSEKDKLNEVSAETQAKIDALVPLETQDEIARLLLEERHQNWKRLHGK